MASRTRIAVDCMGGDQGLRVSLPAAFQSLSRFPDLDLFLVGDSARIESRLGDIDRSRVTLVHADEVVEMTDKPSQALRKKRQSSMRIAINLLHEKKVDGVVSAGNTGALMAIGCYVLNTLPGIDRPAICSTLPTATGHCHLLDLGANVDSSADNLHQFAIMATTLAAAIDGNPAAKVAVLNIGEEEIKGNEQVKLAAKLIEADPGLNFVGSIEGDTLFAGGADVIVCDGFVGNVALKVCEGTASHIGAIVKAQFSKNFITRLMAAIASPVLRRIYQIVDPQQYNGASFLGLQGVVVKSHGNSTVEGFVQAIAKARCEIQSNIIQTIDQRLAELHDHS